MPFRGDVGAGKSSLSGTDEVLPDVMVFNYTPIVYISITAGVETNPPESRLLALRLLALGLVVLVCAVTDGPS